MHAPANVDTITIDDLFYRLASCIHAIDSESRCLSQHFAFVIFPTWYGLPVVSLTLNG